MPVRAAGVQQQRPAHPVFAQAAAETAMLLLQRTPASEDLLSEWLRASVSASSSAADLARAKAVVAAVAGAEVVPPGAQLLGREGIRNVLLTGDLELLSLVMLWVNRLPAPVDAPIGPAAAEDDAA